MDDTLNNRLLALFKTRVNDLEATINLKLSAYRNSHEGYTDMTIYEPQFKVDVNIMSVLLTYSGMATWIEEYGSGSAMDTDSPYYGVYKAAMSADRVANNNAFTGHAKGDIYYDPAGKQVVAKSNRLKGKNLEVPIGKLKPYVPDKAQHLITNEIKAWCQQMRQELGQEVKLYTIERITKGAKG